MKAIVFDFDETLGHFGELGEFVENLEHWFNAPIKREILYALLDTFPFFFRPQLFKLLNLIKRLKQDRIIGKVIIYTNNMAPRSWVLGVKKYLELKINYPLFDRVISAWKVDGKIIERKRTSHGKTYNDLLKCAHLSRNTKVLFFDDQEHPIMEHQNVLGVHVIPYTYIINGEELVNRFLHSKLKCLIKNPERFKKFMSIHMSRYWNKKTRRKHPISKGEYKAFVKKIKILANS